MIREATEADFEAILDLSESFWQHTQYDEPFEREHTRNYVMMAHDHGLLAVADISGQVVGFCAAIKGPVLGSSKAIASVELAWYVTPEHRGGKSGVALLHFMEQLAIDQGVKYFNMLYMESSMPETIPIIYEALGYHKAETSYTKVLNGSNHISGNRRGRNVRSSEKAI